MARINVPTQHPHPIARRRFCNNGQAPTATVLRRIARAQNFAAQWCKKPLVSYGYAVANTPAPTNATNDYAGFLFRTGENVSRLVAQVGIASWYQTGSAPTNPPQLRLWLRDSSAATTTDWVTHRLEGGASYTPFEIKWHRFQLACDEETIYRLVIQCQGYCRPHAIAVWEESSNPVNDTASIIANPTLFEIDSEIYAEGVEALLEAGDLIYKHNAAPLMSFSARNGSAGSPAVPAISATSWVNVCHTSFSSASSTSPGFYVPLQYRKTRSNATHLEFAVRYSAASLGANTLDVRLHNGTDTLIEITGLDNVPSQPCDVVTGTTTANTNEKWDLQAQVSGGSANIEAVALWEYEA